MKKTTLLLSALALGIAGANAQVPNRAIQFESTGTVDCGQVPALDDLNSYTVQFWINPTQWTEGATILSRGDKFTAKLGAPGSIVFTVGEKSVTATSADLKAGEWNGVMLNCSHKSATLFVNNTEAGSGALDAVPATDEPLVLGGGYSGKLDEVRVWKLKLNSDFDYFTNNTLNKWAPQWENLLVYYKMDQADNVDVLINYRTPDDPDQKWNNHGIMSDGVRRVSADNDKMPYLWNAAYTENSRFFDRTIPRDQYLLSNAVIILGADCNATTGEVYPRTPNYHLTDMGNAKYMTEYEGRNGVVSLDGSTRLTAPGAVAAQSNAYAFNAWVYLEEWTPGAYLFRRETEDQKNGVACYLGDDDKRVYVRVNGKLFGSSPDILPTNQWVRFSVTTGSGGSNTFAFRFYAGSNMSNCDRNAASADERGTDVKATGNDDCPTYIGEGLKGKLDEISFWKTASNSNVNLPRIDRNATVADMGNCLAYYEFNEASEPGFSSLSQDNWLRIMKSAYDGYAGARFYYSVNGSVNANPSWTQIISNAQRRKKFAETLAALAGPYDGVELDLEWVYDAGSWKTYSLLSDEIRAALPADKEFRISTHNVTYQYPKDKMADVSGFTFQQYGPQPTHFNYNTFVNYCNAFVNYGYPKDKIVTSYSTTTSNGQQVGGSGTTPIKGVRDNFFADGYQLTDAVQEYKEIGGYNYYFMGPMQVYKRAKYTREQGFQGIFYWDMGNDYWLGDPANPVMPEFNSAKYCSYGLNSNVDPIMTGAKAIHYRADGDYPDGVEDIVIENGETVTVYPSPATDNATITLANGEAVDEINVFSLGGSTVLTQSENNTINVSGLQPGLYLITVKGESGSMHKTKFTVK